VCGLCGVLAADAQADVSQLVGRLSDGLAHRGPDGNGTLFARGRSIGLGHRRLSILDVSGGAQPMSTSDGRLHLVYNGEIYNCADLRAELVSEGYSFHSHSDTEVLLQGWAAWGEALLPRLNGIYAFVVLDSRAGRWSATLVRDPVGAKPLYLGRNGDAWWFASELGAARSAGAVSGDLDLDALAQFLVYRFIPAPRTAYRSSWKVPAGHLVRLEIGQDCDPEFRPFPRGFIPASIPACRAEWEAAMRDGIRKAVSRQLMSDVPVGVLLSGGVDSAIVTGCMHAAAGGPPDAFAIGFTSESDGGELQEAGIAARALGVPLHTTEASDGDYLRAWPSLLRSFGEPIANSGLLLVGLLCESVRRTHKVVLSGQGADEPLGGYPRHAAGRWAQWVHRGSPLLDRLPERLASSDRVRRLRRVAGADDEPRRIAEVLAVFGVAEVASLSRVSHSADLLTDPASRALALIPPGADDLNRLLMVDARLSLADDLLLVADHMSMAHSVELRVPFLDLEFLALVERMPGAYKVSLLGERKWLYRKAVASMLPADLRGRLLGPRARLGRKLGFATPMDRWFSSWVRSDAERTLLGAGAALPDLLHPEPVRQLLAEARRGRPRTRQLLSLYALEGWLQGHSTGRIPDAA